MLKTKEVSSFSFIYRIANFLPIRFKLLAFLFKKYVDYYNNDNNIDMLSNGEYLFAKRQIKNKDIVFDIGANVGEWSLKMSNEKKNITIHAFEPSKGTYKKLLENCEGKNIVCNNLALGSKNDTGELFLYSKNAGINSFYFRDGVRGIFANSKTEPVKIITFDSYCKTKKIKKVDFVKIDVEGHEVEVLRGMGRSLKLGLIGCIQIEYGGTYIDSRTLLKDVFEIAKINNYLMYKITQDDYKLCNNYRQTYENFQYSNWIMVKRGVLKK